jgi:pimeloyl-ACP methyl ester carboxylesterase
MESVMSATPRETIAAALRGMAERSDSTKLLSDIHVPTLLLCGEHDAITPPQEMRTMAHVMPDARYVQIPAAGHMAPLESPAATNTAILEFLGE